MTTTNNGKPLMGMDDATLTGIAQRVGAMHGYDDVKAEFTPFRDFKVKWMRSHRWIQFDVSDYLRNAPEHIMESVMDTIFAKIRNADNSHYSADVCDYLTSDPFVTDNQPIYLRRVRGIDSDTHKVHDLRASYDRLVSAGLVQPIEGIVFGYCPSNRSKTVGQSSVLMRVVQVSDELDSVRIPQQFIDYVVYSQVCHIALGFNRSGEDRSDRYRAMLTDYPDYDGIEDMFDDLGYVLP